MSPLTVASPMVKDECVFSGLERLVGMLQDMKSDESGAEKKMRKASAETLWCSGLFLSGCSDGVGG